jgi:hypothetical protein
MALQTLVFNATGASDVLSFFAIGNPAGSPPFVLLDGVAIADVPEPASWAVMALGLAGMPPLYRRRAATAWAADPAPLVRAARATRAVGEFVNVSIAAASG